MEAQTLKNIKKHTCRAKPQGLTNLFGKRDDEKLEIKLK
jgi:hypothetical protein